MYTPVPLCLENTVSVESPLDVALHISLPFLKAPMYRKKNALMFVFLFLDYNNQDASSSNYISANFNFLNKQY